MTFRGNCASLLRPSRNAATTHLATALAVCGMLGLLAPAASRAQSAPAAQQVAMATLPDAPMPSDDVMPVLKKHGAADAAQQQGSSSSSEQQGAPQAPGAQAPSLEDLGLQSRPDPDLQAKLDRRTRMLKVHQRMGLITLAPLAAACLSSAAAPPDPRHGSGNTVGRDIHLSLGAVSVVSYGITASYAIRAPRVSHEPARGGIKLHKYLIYVHAPGMILTPVLGAMAFQQANNGEKVHGIASAHAAVAWTTVAAYTASIVAVSWPIHIHSL